tara:strand:+ start:1068 stop:1355 length:288 start_codon:yes stop_codon:yes gene_type:complete
LTKISFFDRVVFVQQQHKKRSEMYIDDPPYPNTPSKKVVVVGGKKDVDKVIRLARQNGATTRDYDGNEVFWIVFEDKPKRIWDFTERALRKSIAR